jgi:hypothetical protein
VSVTQIIRALRCSYFLSATGWNSLIGPPILSGQCPIILSQVLVPPGRLRVNRTSASGDIKSSPPSPSTSHEPGEPSPTPGERPHPHSPLAHLVSLALTHPRVSSSLSPTSLAVCCQPRSSALLSPSLNRTLRFHHSLPLVLYPLYCRCCLCFSPCLLFMDYWVENAPPRSTIELPKRMAECRGSMKRKITESRRQKRAQREI